MKFLEQHKRLSESILWDLQSLAYTQFGPEAWANKGVPFYLTSNPLIAKQFSFVIFGYLRDCLNNRDKLTVDSSEPFYLFDLGAGSGRLGYLILKHLLPLVDEYLQENIHLRYVMTDMVESNIEFWRKHDDLREYIDKGVLDFAYYHHQFQEPLYLQQSCRSLTPENIQNPVTLICTYFFDTVPQDYFRAKNGVLEEGRITITLPDEHIDKIEPWMIEKLCVSYDYVPIEDPSHYYPNSPRLNSILDQYRTTFDETTFLFPSGGFEALSYFEELSKGRLLLMAGDQGVCTLSQIKVWGEPEVFRHASFSMAVSYHALEIYFREQGGFGLLTSFPKPKFVVTAAVVGGGTELFPRTCLAFREHIDFFEPVDYWALTNLSENQLTEMSLEHILLFIKLGSWDPVNFHLFFPVIRKKAAVADHTEKEKLQRVIGCVWEQFYPVCHLEGEFVMNLGVLLFEIGYPQKAYLMFQRALKIGGESVLVYQNLSRAAQTVGDEAKAREYYQKAVSMNS